MTPSEVGERAEGAVLAALLKVGGRVLLPFGGSFRYDMALDAGGSFYRIQVKHGVVRSGGVRFRPRSSTGRGEFLVAKNYLGDADFFGVYCSENDQTYLLPVAGCPEGTMLLRLEPPLNGRMTGVRWAKDYLVTEELLRGIGFLT